MLEKHVAVAALITLSLSTIAQKPSGTTKFYPATPLPGVAPDVPMMQMPSAIPLFVTGGNFTSTLTLVNVSTSTTYADITVRASNGGTLAAKRVDFAPHSQQRVDIGQLLSARSSSFTTGSILIVQSADLMGPTILAHLGMTYLGSADRNFIDEEVFMPEMMGSQVLEGVADRGDGSPIVAVSSLAESAQHITVQCLGEQGAAKARRITLAAGQTTVVDACAATSEINETDFAFTLDRTPDVKRGPEGIRLISDAMPGSFAAFALVPHGQTGERFFSSVLFDDPMSFRSPNTVFTGIPVGPTALLPGSYTPQ